MKSKKLLATLTCAAVLAAPGAAFADSTDLQLIVNSGHVAGSEAEGQAYINDAGRTMIPLRVVNTVLGYQTDWQADGNIHITGDDGKVDVTLKIGDNDYIANGTAGTFETAPTLKNDRTYLPARDFTELYGQIHWDSATRTVWISQGVDLDYQVVGEKILRANADGIKALALPDGYSIYNNGSTDPIVNEKTIDGVHYLGIMNKDDWQAKIPLYRDNGDSLSYVADIYACANVAIDGDTLYATDGVLASGWDYKVNPNRLSITDTTTGKTTEKILDFVVNDCTLAMNDGQLTATSPDGTQHVVALK
ncbi:MAG: copper amine oxidase N-terminal domain-containing protein [Peptococcaceae bacterium]|nr:copper amine oxidase N-terminal domain-containing protein [Peptococcaceae bacterium]